MNDKEKVIKGAIFCVYGTAPECKNCPYDDGIRKMACRKSLIKDALSLLKEQKTELLQQEAELDILRNIYNQENPTKQAVKWE